MQGNISFSGLLWTAQEWDELDPELRAELVEAAAHPSSEGWIVAPVSSIVDDGSRPRRR